MRVKRYKMFNKYLTIISIAIGIVSICEDCRCLSVYKTNQDNAQILKLVELQEYLPRFVEAFEYYDSCHLLSREGRSFLSLVKLLYSRGQEEWFEILQKYPFDLAEAYKIVQYFSAIPEKDALWIKENFPRRLFKPISKELLSDASPQYMEIVNGCPNGCKFCLWQKHKKTRCMPYPLAVLLSLDSHLNSTSYCTSEPLYYKDPCGALFYDVQKLFCGPSRLITHGYIEEMEDVAKENIARINSAGEDYDVVISVNLFDAFFDGISDRTDEEILQLCYDRYIGLVDSFNERHKIYMRYQDFSANIGKYVSLNTRRAELLAKLEQKLREEFKGRRNIVAQDSGWRLAAASREMWNVLGVENEADVLKRSFWFLDSLNSIYSGFPFWEVGWDGEIQCRIDQHLLVPVKRIEDILSGEEKNELMNELKYYMQSKNIHSASNRYLFAHYNSLLALFFQKHKLSVDDVLKMQNDQLFELCCRLNAPVPTEFKKWIYHDGFSPVYEDVRLTDRLELYRRPVHPYLYKLGRVLMAETEPDDSPILAPQVFQSL